MKRFPALAALTAALVLCSCNGGSENASVSMLITQGFGEEFYKTLAEDIGRDLGIDIEFVYENSSSPSTMLLQDFINADLQADIVFTYAKIPDKYLETCCLDFVAESNLLSHYSHSKVAQFITGDGCAYQLPLTSRLVGITYNATLMAEKGWELPRTFDDMVELKRKCDADGTLFAVTDIKYTGHPFNYMFNMLGSQWLSSVSGEKWLEGFLTGGKSMHIFKEKAEYFRRWVESGLFGDLADTKSHVSKQFGRERALFCFSNHNNFTGYKGPMYGPDGKPNGRMLDDTFKSMPWISGDGSNNCFTAYDNNWVAVRRTAATDNKKLSNILAVLDYMMSDRYMKIAMQEGADLYCILDEVDIESDRLYYDFADRIRRGYLQPWYYNRFEEETIIETGREIASYIINYYMEQGWRTEQVRHYNYSFNPDATFDSAVSMLRNSLHAHQEDYLGWAEDDLGPSDIARLSAISGALALQEAGVTADAGLMPYAGSLRDLQPWKGVAVQSASVHAGPLSKSYSYIFEPAGCFDVYAVKMTGAELRGIVAGGFNPSDRFVDPATGESTFDSSHYGPYRYALALRGEKAGSAPDADGIDDGREYLVALCPPVLTSEMWEKFSASGRLVTLDGEPVNANLARGIQLYFQRHATISTRNITWE